MASSRAGRILAISLVVASSACSNDSTNPDPGSNGNPTLSLTLSASTISLVQGTSGEVTATIARAGGFAGSVTIDVTGAPSGLTATPSPATIGSTATTSTITIAPDVSVAPGNHVLTVRASGTGVSAATRTVTVTVTAASIGSFTLGIDPASATIRQGQQTVATVNISRTGGFTGSVDLAVSGGPGSGLIATLSPASTTGNTSTLTLASAASLAAGTYNLTVTGNAAGLTQQAASFALGITVAGGGNTTWTYCTDRVPTWFAYQDGTGPWTQVLPDNGRFTFPIDSGRGAVAVVTDASLLEIFLGTQAELNQYGSRCGGTGTTASKTVNGTMSGLTTTDQGFVAFGGSSAVVTSGQSAFTLQNVFEGAFDLVASRSSLIVQGNTVTAQMTAGIIRRGLDPADNSTLPDLDFNGAEAFTPDSRNLTIGNLGTDQAIVSSFFITGNGGAASLYTDAGVGGGASRTIFAVPNAVRQSGDLQFIQVSALADLSQIDLRSATSYFASSSDQTVMLGPTLDGLNVSTVGTSGYARIAATYTIQTEYDDLFTLTGSQISGRTFHIFVTKGYAGGTATVTCAIPDFSGVGGWMNTWGPQVGSEIAWSFSATGYSTDGGFTAPLQDGVIALTATSGGRITP